MGFILNNWYEALKMTVSVMLSTLTFFFSFLTGVIRNFSVCLSKFDVFIRNWLACFEKVSFLYGGSFCISH